MRYILLTAASLGLSAVGLGALAIHSNAPGASVAPPATWPEGSAVQRQPGKPTLVMVVHPQCPCSRASLAELSRLLARRAGSVTAVVLFVRPAEEPEGWEQTDTWKSAKAIPGVTVLVDVGGVEAARFHAVTSGTTLLFGPGGEELFSGGITAARAHEGPSAGQDAISAILDAEIDGGVTAPVFGCSLTEPTGTKQ